MKILLLLSSLLLVGAPAAELPHIPAFPGAPKPVAFQSELVIVRAGATLIMREAALPFEPPAEKLTAHAAYLRALESAGASKPKRDAVDARIIAGVRDGSGRQIKTIAEDAWPALRGTAPEPDSDGDGLPDAWETAHALKPADPADAAFPASPEGWTQLEVWLNVFEP